MFEVCENIGDRDGERMIEVILFPCEIFSVNQVDSCFQNELYVDLKKYGEDMNEWRAFYLFGNVLSVSRNSGQQDCATKVPIDLVEKYKNLPSTFYTVDFAELSDGSWKIIETGDGQVSGLPNELNTDEFFRRVREQ